ncbi:hypothetical protein HH110_06740 [Stenotrophomonas sp. SAM-B]|uniref:hypothetical protein n=1 Tax=Stenotrophomonas sp. SAM-B TaxID=2729141 RepID=UPI0015A3F6CE|nr:hypothetical protein [Stenotrophomonas sp. SAM-B]NWF32738.1 hypothetical protein [Stenotrophomonas sp. SAM-B]
MSQSKASHHATAGLSIGSKKILNQQHISEISTIVEQLTVAPAKTKGTGYARFVAAADLWFILFYVVLLLVVIGLGVGLKYFDFEPLTATAVLPWIVVPMGIAGIVYAVLNVTDITIRLIKRRSDPHGEIMTQIRLTTAADADLASRLATYGKRELEYVLVQYETKWGLMEDRVALLVGNIRKLGLMPMLAAITAGSVKLFDKSASVYWGILLVALLPAVFAIMGFVAIASRERIKQVTEILKFAIRHALDKRVAPDEVTEGAASAAPTSL